MLRDCNDQLGRQRLALQFVFSINWFCCVESAQHTLWVGTRGGSLGALNIIRERGQVLELKATGYQQMYYIVVCNTCCIGLGRHFKESIKGIHFHQYMIVFEKYVAAFDFSSDGKCITIVLNACLIVSTCSRRENGD